MDYMICENNHAVFTLSLPEIIYPCRQEIRHLVYQQAIGLAEATFGEPKPDGTRPYCISRDHAVWLILGVRSSNQHSFYQVEFYFDGYGAVSSIAIRHAKGRQRSQDISEAGIARLFSDALLAGPIPEGE